MKFNKTLLVLSIVVTLIGIITGRYFFVLLGLPLNFFGIKKNKDFN